MTLICRVPSATSSDSAAGPAVPWSAPRPAASAGPRTPPSLCQSAALWPLSGEVTSTLVGPPAAAVGRQTQPSASTVASAATRRSSRILPPADPGAVRPHRVTSGTPLDPPGFPLATPHIFRAPGPRGGRPTRARPAQGPPRRAPATLRQPPRYPDPEGSRELRLLTSRPRLRDLHRPRPRRHTLQPERHVRPPSCIHSSVGPAVRLECVNWPPRRPSARTAADAVPGTTARCRR